jgi:peptidylprolyl isomerase
VRRLVVVVLLGSIALVGAAIPAGARSSSPLADVQVTGPVGEKPTLEFTKPFSTKKTVHREITAGAGAELAKGDKVSLNILVVDARTGTEIENSFGVRTDSFVLDTKQTVPGLVKSLLGSSVGSRVLIALAPKEGVVAGVTEPDVKKDDTLLFVIDVVSAQATLERATGTPVAPVAGLPTVKLGKHGKPTVKVPKSEPPKTLVAQPLIVGAGPVVVAGQTITVHYTGVIWKSGKTFDSSWQRGAPIDFPIGAGQVIPGWDEGLVGQTIGSQVLLVIPPDEGYGAGGQPDAGISGTDTLVFVVDILDAS